MECRTYTYNAEDLIEKMEKNKLTFDYPIQRDSDQWDKSQKALFIDTLMNGYLVPDLYIIKEGTEDFTQQSVLDGKQRFMTLYEFWKDGFKLPKDADPITIKDVTFDEDKNPVEEIHTYEVAGKCFSKLEPELQKRILKFKFSVKLLAGYTDEQIEEQFYRLNNGCTFTKSQKANVKLGTKLAGQIKEIEECNFFQNRAAFSNSQKKRGEITSCILQTLMLVTGYDYKNFGANEVVKFAEYFNENPNYDAVEQCKALYEKLWDILPAYNKELDSMFKKIHIPMMVMNLDYLETVKEDVGYEMSDEEYTEFLNKWFTVWNETSGYIDFCGAGSTGKTKVEGRIVTINKELREYALRLARKAGENGEDIENNQDESGRLEAAS